MIRAVLFCFGLLAPSLAHAASSDWVQANGARLRLVTAETADAAGSLQGVLQIDLEPGWKTYWKDPGDAGIPPQIDVSTSMNVSGAALSFPAPTRFSEGDEMSIGYTSSVDLPVTFTVADPAGFVAIDADVFLGICREICVPVQVRLSVTPGGAAGELDPAISNALALLPAPASADFGLVGVQAQDDALVAQVALPDGSAAGADLFMVAPDGWALGLPVPTTDAEAPGFRIPVVRRPEAAPAAARLDYTLVAGGKAVAGTLDLR